MAQAIAKFGSIIYVDFPEQVPSGIEQKNYRPAILVGFPDNLGEPRFPIYIVIPLSSSSDAISWVEKSPDLYMFLSKGTGNLKYDSIVLLDQIRAVDPKRIKKLIGNLPEEKCMKLKQRLKKLFDI